MKTFSKFQFDNSFTPLTQDELKNVLGGQEDQKRVYTCYCGFTGGPYEDIKFLVVAESTEEALNAMNCGGVGVTCS